MNPGVAKEPFDRGTPYQAIAAMKQLAFMHHFIDQFATQRLDHRDLSETLVALVVGPCCFLHKVPSRTKTYKKHCEALADGLFTPQAIAEGLSLRNLN
jgi:hypothetical protein